MQYTFFTFLFLFAINLSAQKKALLDCAVKLDTITEQADIEVYILSDPRCGYCQKAIKEIGNWAEEKSVSMSIIAMDISGNPEAVKKLEGAYSKYNVEVRDASQCNERLQKFIPRIYIKDSKTNKIVMKSRGWTSEKFKKLDKKLKKYYNTKT
jgi:thiol-disulfide isomerase/thioredoxin